MQGRPAAADPRHALVTVGSGFRSELVTSTILSRRLADQVLIDPERATQLVFDAKECEARVRLLEFQRRMLPPRDQQVSQADLAALIGRGRRGDDLVRTRERSILDVLEFLLQ